MTFVARKSTAERLPLSLSELRSKMHVITESFGRQLTDQSGWNGADAGLAVLAYAVGLISNAKCIADVESDAAALILIGKDVKKSFPDFSLKVRSSL